MLNKRGVMIFSIVIIISSMFFHVSAEEFVSDSGVEYDSEIVEVFNNHTLVQEMIEKAGVEYESDILEILNNQTWIRLLIRLNDNSGIEITGTSDEKIELIEQRDKWFGPVIENVLSDLPKSKIKEIRRRSDGFSVMITEENFNKLINDSRVKKIIWPKEKVRLFLDDSAPLINATYAWNTLGYTGEGIKVCVIDTGVEKNHLALQGRIISEKCYCYNNCCPNGQNSDNNASDDNGHGTHVSWIKKARLFFIIPINIKIETKINVKTGDIEFIKKPW